MNPAPVLGRGYKKSDMAENYTKRALLKLIEWHEEILKEVQANLDLVLSEVPPYMPYRAERLMRATDLVTEGHARLGYYKNLLAEMEN